MKPKVLLVIGLILVCFFGEIAISFSYKNESDRNLPDSEIIPLSYKIPQNQGGELSMEAVDSMMQLFMRKNQIQGASVAIAKEGRLVYAKGFGWADEENSETVNPFHLFRIASVSKLITAITVMKLIEENKLHIDDVVFGPEGILKDRQFYSYKDKRIESINIHHLLNHTSGWEGKKGDPVFNSLYVARTMGVEPPAKTEDIINFSLKNGLNYTPGKKYSYSNLGYCILGEIIEEVTGMAYEDYVQFAILHPLGIYDMHIGKSFEQDRYINEVKYYNKENTSEIWAFDGSKQLVPIVYGGNNIELLGAAGGWVASAPELAKLMVSIDGFSSRPDILSDKTIREMTRANYRTKKLIGWRGSDGYGTWWRTGTFAGSSALLLRHREEINYVILVNTSTKKKSKIHNEISRTMFKTIRMIDQWPEHDLFNTVPNANPETDLAHKN